MRDESVNEPPMVKGPITMANGEVLTDADFERMAREVETADIDVERLLQRALDRGGRPSLGEGISPVLQVRLDRETQTQLVELAEADHTTPSAVARDAIKAFLKGRLKAS